MKSIPAFLLVIFFAAHSGAEALSETCSWCVTKNTRVINEIKEISARAPADQLKAVRNRDICVNVVGAGIKLAPGEFAWGQVEKPVGHWADVTVQRDTFAKTLCRGEKPIANKCATIALNAAAKKVFLIRELLYYRQMEADRAWCPLSKSLWTRTATPQENIILQNKQWDVHRALWEHRKSITISDEDRILVYATLINLARLRKWHDPTAVPYIQKNKIENELAKTTSEFMKKQKRK